ncbi:hypothetical protein [Thermococcus sp. Bubb.Bath]|uniref:hypothetical protein n=1 Tax=Thermococcus sp. Bubb.Bath TaxID=1638242 RepID=UPI00143A9FA2|nr:hypothetical protein [Thermococcus sp. Bubb.Bath]NJF24145.1 hypothetical protein [Thermococcus sp. Bubb.Bath]
MKRTTVAGIVVVFLWLTMMVPHVNALSVECPSTANLSETTCNVTGNPGEKFGIYLSSVNGFALEPGEVTLWVNSSGDVRFAWFRDFRWFHQPAEVRFEPYDALQMIVHEFDGPFSGDITWMFLGKENRFTFTVVYPDGRSENFTAEVLLAGKPNWNGILSDYLGLTAFVFIMLSFVTFLLVMAIFLIARFLGASSLSPRKGLYFSAGTVLMFILIFSSDFLSAVIFYSIGTPERAYGDMILGWGLAFILAMILLYSSGVHSWVFESNWRKKTLKELKRIDISFCSGMDWFPWVLLTMGPSGINVNYWIWLMVSLIFLFGFLTDRILNLLTPLGVLGVNFALSLVLYLLIHPDVGFIAVLWLGVLGIYLSQRRCIRKFNAEKEKWVREAERRLKRLEGLSSSTTSPSTRL